MVRCWGEEKHSLVLWLGVSEPAPLGCELHKSFPDCISTPKALHLRWTGWLDGEHQGIFLIFPFDILVELMEVKLTKAWGTPCDWGFLTHRLDCC